MSDDTVRRQDAIEALRAMAVPRYKDPECEDIWERDRTLDRAIDVLRGLPSAQQWILVADRMPEQRVLVLIMYYTNKGRHFYGIDFYNGVGFITENVTHWMPLPDPPKGEDDERTD